MAVSADLAKLIDKRYAGLPLGQLLDAPVTALAGVSESDADFLLSAFGIRTLRDLGRNRCVRVVAALADLENTAR